MRNRLGRFNARLRENRNERSTKHNCPFQRKLIWLQTT